MARRSRSKRHVLPKNTRSVDENLGPRLRNALVEALPDASIEVRERLARTAVLSRREAQRYLVVAATEQNLPEANVEKARTVIDELAEA